ncbi:hypothetical protein AAMO2058_001260200 [Amorphochlora amoebiformis]
MSGSGTGSVSDSSGAYAWTQEDHDEVKRFFSILDTDNSGHIDKEEAAKLPGPGAFFRDCDADSDGHVTWEEFTAYLKKRTSASKPHCSIAFMFANLSDLLEGKKDKETLASDFKLKYRENRKAEVKVKKTQKD